MLTAQSIGFAFAISTLLWFGTPAYAQDAVQEDLTPCPGSAAEPTQSAEWPVSFCNRTDHDLVIEFHDNECPAEGWNRRGDVYQRTLRRGESKRLPLCYANEPRQAKSPAPGTPMLRIPGGKGVVTTWTVVGDCGDRSKPLNLDAKSFYDRGEYRSGIILLQYPTGAAHCLAESGASSAPASTSSRAAAIAPATALPAPAVQSATPASGSPQAPESRSARSQTQGSAQESSAAQPTVAADSAAAASASASNNGPPTLSAMVDAKDVVGRTVRVFAHGSGAPGYKCNFTLALKFSDGGSWNDHAKATVTGTEGSAPVATRKYLKSVASVELNSTKCTPQ